MIDPTEQFGASWLQRVKAEMKRKPRRSLFLAFLVLILVGIWVKLLLGGGPGAVSAAPAPALDALLAPADAGATAAAAGGAPRTLAEWARQRTGPVTRNLFAVPFDGYPLDPAHPIPQTQQSAKSGLSEADQTRERQALIDSVRADAGKLVLEGIVTGSTPRVWVNGTLVGVGQAVGDSGFKVVRIEARRILVERDGVQVELTMK